MHCAQEVKAQPQAVRLVQQALLEQVSWAWPAPELGAQICGACACTAQQRLWPQAVEWSMEGLVTQHMLDGSLMLISDRASVNQLNSQQANPGRGSG